MRTATHGTLSIGDLAERTGVSAATLRVWESRYGFPAPVRLESGHRRYSEVDVTLVLDVVRRKDAGTRLGAAVDQARSAAEPTAPSVFAHLRVRQPHLPVRRLRKATMLALSWAIEDEFCVKAQRGLMFGAFQREEHYRSSQARWQEIDRVSAGTTVFADFGASDAAAAPSEVALEQDAPMRREWAVVCASPGLPVVLSGWEAPAQTGVADGDRIFEAVWSVDPAVVQQTVEVCVGVAEQADPAWRTGRAGRAAGATADRQRPEPDGAAMTALVTRMVSYLDGRA